MHGLQLLSAPKHAPLIHLLEELEAVAVALQAQVEAPEAVPREAVRPAAHDDGLRLVQLHHLRFERVKREGMCTEANQDDCALQPVGTT